MIDVIKSYLMELIGAFFLVFVVGMTTVESSLGVSAPFAIGLTLLIMILIGGHISGGHYNPAVTIATVLAGKIENAKAIWFVFSQLCGASLAALLVLYLKDFPDVSAMDINIKSFIVEIIFTFALVTAVLSTTLIIHPLSVLLTAVAVGLVVATGALSVGSISGASFNPSVVLGNAIMGAYSWNTIWIIIMANIGGGFLAVLFTWRMKSISSSRKYYNSGNNAAQTVGESNSGGSVQGVVKNKVVGSRRKFTYYVPTVRRGT